MAHVDSRRLKNGEWRYDGCYRDARGKERSKAFKSRKEAERYATQMEVDVARGCYVDPANRSLPFCELAEEWLMSNAAKRRSTLARERSIIDNHLVPRFGEQRIGRIQRRAVA